MAVIQHASLDVLGELPSRSEARRAMAFYRLQGPIKTSVAFYTQRS